MDPKLTAFAIARIRDEEGQRRPEDRLFVDPYAHLFDDTQVDVDPVFAQIPFFLEQVRLRTRYIDECVREALSTGTRQIVLVGAGFDCRALRMPEIGAAGARVIEIDHAEQLRAKRERFADARVTVPSIVEFAPADLSSVEGDSLAPALREAGIEERSPVLWVCEGLLGYLPQSSIARLAAVTRALSGPGSTLVANHFVHTWSFEALSDLFGNAGWAAHPGPSFHELHAKWIGSDVPPGSELFAFVVARH